MYLITKLCIILLNCSSVNNSKIWSRVEKKVVRYKKFLQQSADMKTLFYCLLLLATAACHTSSRLQRFIVKTSEFDSLKKQTHLGFALFDPESQKYIYEWNSEQYFLPASNTKLLTYFVADAILPDSVPTYQLCEVGDTLVVLPFGDPSFLNPKFTDQRAFTYLKQSTPTLQIDFRYFQDSTYGEGWMWDDYFYAFATEKAPFPIYGNLAEVKTDEQGNYQSYAFQDRLRVSTQAKRAVSRNRFSNTFFVSPKQLRANHAYRIPFRWSIPTFLKLLSDTLHRQVSHRRQAYPTSKCARISNTTKQKLFTKLLHNSDNLVAEQLLLLCSQLKLDSMNTQRMIQYALANELSFLSDRVMWVDGSGVSRYNLITPKSLTELLYRIYQKHGMAAIQEVFPQGSRSGTVEENFAPYVFAKTGTLRNQFCLSGFIQTDSKKWQIFSIMSNHFSLPNREVRRMIQGILRFIHRRG